jgi:hypothetical protein
MGEGRTAHRSPLFYGSSRNHGAPEDVASIVLRLPATSSRRVEARRHGAEPSVPGRFGAEPSVPTLAAQTPLRVSYRKAAAAAHVSIWPTAAPLVGNSPRGWAPKTLPNPEVRGDRADEATPLRLPVHRHRHAVNQPASRDRPREAAQRRGSRSARRNVRTSTTAVTTGFRRHAAQRLSFHSIRIVVRDLGVHPRGEFRTSGAAVGQ